MRAVARSMPEIEKRVARAHGIFVFLDFDGTLADIAPTPAQAKLLPATRALLRRCGALFPTAIVSGRALADLERKVGVDDLMYAGTHGLEWRIGARYGRRQVPAAARRAIKALAARLARAAAEHPGILIEPKDFALAAHYRRLSPAAARRFRRLVHEAAAPFVRAGTLEVVQGKKVLEFRPCIGWTKADAVRMLLRGAAARGARGTGPLAIYIGDDRTDEDAFAMFSSSGITVRVGKRKGSAASYYFARRSQVDGFLRRLAEIAEERQRGERGEQHSRGVA